ncbi:MAG TPA: hypothetical protein VNG11_02160 [Chloroflexota bacterium]|nr:hypothetical protein [Chloroflexota bacterium]
MLYVPTTTAEAKIREILSHHETAVVVEAGDSAEILSVANYPSACREYYIGRLVLAVFRREADLDGRLAIARARAQ